MPRAQQASGPRESPGIFRPLPFRLEEDSDVLGWSGEGGRAGVDSAKSKLLFNAKKLVVLRDTLRT